MANAREQYLQAMASFTEMTRTRAEQLAGRLAKQGDLQSGQVGRFAEDLVRRTQRNRETMSRLIQREVKRQLSLLGIATRDEVARLQQRVRALEQVAERQAAASSRAAQGGATTGRATGGRSRSAAAGTSTRGPARTTARKTASEEAGGRTTSATGRSAGTKGAGTAGTGTTGGRARRGSSQTGQDPTKGE